MTFANAGAGEQADCAPMRRFLVSSGHTGREPPASYIVEADSARTIEKRYPVFANQPSYKLPEERPAWLTDLYLAVIEKSAFRLGADEPTSLKVLLHHLARGDTWRWYALEQRPEDSETIAQGELGTFRELKLGSDVGGLPRKPGRWRVVAVEPPPHPGVVAKLVIASAEST